jgi:hypothetical protein
MLLNHKAWLSNPQTLTFLSNLVQYRATLLEKAVLCTKPERAARAAQLLTHAQLLGKLITYATTTDSTTNAINADALDKLTNTEELFTYPKCLNRVG